MKSEEAVVQELERERIGRESETTGIEPSAPSTRFMIAGEAPVVVEKACELMVKELTIRAWRHTERNRRRTLQRQDVHAAVGESEMFDFLIDLVPRIVPPVPAPGIPLPVPSAGASVPPVPQPSNASVPAAPVPGAQQHEQQLLAEPQAGMNLSDAETRYAQLHDMQSQMHEHYMMLQQRAGADGSVPVPGTIQAAVDGQQPQVVLNPQYMIHPPQGAMPQWQANPEDEANTMPDPEGGA